MHYYLLHNCGFVGFLLKSGEVRLTAVAAFGGEVRAASFVLGQAVPGESEDIRIRRLQIQQDMVDAGRLLQKSIAA